MSMDELLGSDDPDEYCPFSFRGLRSYAFQPTDREHEIRAACEALADLLVAKSKSYGDSINNAIDIMPVPEMTPLERIYTRINEKLGRLKNRTAYPGDDDTKDLAGYFVLAWIEKKKEQSK